MRSVPLHIERALSQFYLNLKRQDDPGLTSGLHQVIKPVGNKIFCNPFFQYQFHHPERIQLLEAKVTKWPLGLNDTVLKTVFDLLSLYSLYIVGFLFIENFNHSKVGVQQINMAIIRIQQLPTNLLSVLFHLHPNHLLLWKPSTYLEANPRHHNIYFLNI